jgi:hypothetical protein
VLQAGTEKEVGGGTEPASRERRDEREDKAVQEIDGHIDKR